MTSPLREFWQLIAVDTVAIPAVGISFVLVLSAFVPQNDPIFWRGLRAIRHFLNRRLKETHPEQLPQPPHNSAREEVALDVQKGAPDPVETVSEPVERIARVFDNILGALVVPRSLLSLHVELLQQLERHEVIPYQFRGRLLRQVFTTSSCGYSMDALRRRCAEERASGLDQCALLLIRVADLVIGAFLSEFPEWCTKGSRYFIGTPRTTLFRFSATLGSTTRFCGRTVDEGGNGRFFRADDQEIQIGAGGPGPAVRLTKNLTRVVTAAPSSTFNGLNEPLLPLNGPRIEAESAPDGLRVAAPVGDFELLVLTEKVVDIL